MRALTQLPQPRPEQYPRRRGSGFLMAEGSAILSGADPGRTHGYSWYSPSNIMS
jgi:hypothetical protein